MQALQPEHFPWVTRTAPPSFTCEAPVGQFFTHGASSAPGYARLSFALGDDDLGEGIQRIADLLAK